MKYSAKAFLQLDVNSSISIPSSSISYGINISVANKGIFLS